MIVRERRQDTLVRNAKLREQLNEDQLMTLRDLERFGWELRFIRRVPFQEAIAVVVDGDRKSYSILKPDGTLEDNPAHLRLRL
jgi:hypothetical protein